MDEEAALQTSEPRADNDVALELDFDDPWLIVS